MLSIQNIPGLLGKPRSSDKLPGIVPGSLGQSAFILPCDLPCSVGFSPSSGKKFSVR